MYSEKKRARILEAVSDARGAGLKWPEAHRAAKKAGYRGKLGALMVLVKKGAGGTRKAGRSINRVGLSEIDSIVRREVEARLKVVRVDAIAAFNRALNV